MPRFGQHMDWFIRRSAHHKDETVCPNRNGMRNATASDGLTIRRSCSVLAQVKSSFEIAICLKEFRYDESVVPLLSVTDYKVLATLEQSKSRWFKVIGVQF